MGNLALTGGTPVRGGSWPKWPMTDSNGMRAVEEVLRGNQWSRANGEQVRRFEDRFAAYQGSAYGLAVSSGTAALEVGVRSLNLTRGAEVILSPFTFMASATSILMARCVPIFVDVDLETYNIDPSKIEAAITDRTEAIMTVHFAGLPCDMGPILEIARKYNPQDHRGLLARPRRNVERQGPGNDRRRRRLQPRTRQEPHRRRGRNRLDRRRNALLELRGLP